MSRVPGTPPEIVSPPVGKVSRLPNAIVTSSLDGLYMTLKFAMGCRTCSAFFLIFLMETESI